MERRSFTLAAVLGGAVLAGVTSLAHAQPPARPAQPQRLGDMLNLKPREPGGEAPTAARYAAEGNIVFTFDKSSSTVRFDGANEIIVLVRQRAPGGGAIYVNDVGEPVLRISGLGGMTLFTPERPQGMPVTLVSVAAPIRLEPLLRPGTDLLYWMQSMSLLISRDVSSKARIGIEAPLLEPSQDIQPAELQLLADVVVVAREGVQRAVRRGRGRERMQQVTTIWIEKGAAPAVRMDGRTLRITITPSRGVAGRPSSERIARAITR